MKTTCLQNHFTGCRASSGLELYTFAWKPFNLPLMELIRKYFPGLDQQQCGKLEAMYQIYGEWNQKINLISRKDFDFFYERHVLHSLAIAKLMDFPTGSAILDAGTGGGFPGIPLSIYFPEVKFHLVDSITKKISAVDDIARQLHLDNVTVQCTRFEKLKNRYDYVVSRAVAPLPQMIKWTGHLLVQNKASNPQNGIIYLKGGEVSEELKDLRWAHKIYPLNKIFSEAFFETKLLVHLCK